MKPNEGELSFHARTCEGGSSIFISTSNGEIVLVEDGRTSKRNSPYMNKFGETYSKKSHKWENFSLQNSSSGGSINLYEELRRLYVNFRISNEVIKDRSMSDTVWRVGAI